MKKINGILLTMASALIFTACGNDRSTSTDSTNTSTMSTDTGTGNMGTGNMAGDTAMGGTGMTGSTTTGPDLSGTQGLTNFTTTAASGGMMEVEAAQVAQKSGSSKEVKDLATTILNDHNKANAELKRIAQGKNITVPTSMMPEHQSHLDMLRAKTGAEFDRAYLEMMDQDHAKDIEMFRQASTTLTDAELKAFATKTLPVLQKHHERVKAARNKM